jgi:hypothetical protein
MILKLKLDRDYRLQSLSVKATGTAYLIAVFRQE